MGLTAQEIKVSGVVTGDTKGPLPGTTILAKGTDKKTTSDADGKYSIMTKLGETLQFSYVSLET